MNRLVIAAVAAASLASAGAKANALAPAAYQIAGGQILCLYSDGTWNSTTYANWGGYWGYFGTNTHIWGNFDLGNYAGFGNDSIVVHGHSASWTEWEDDFSYNFVGDPLSFARYGSLAHAGCVEGASRAKPSKLPPAALHH